MKEVAAHAVHAPAEGARRACRGQDLHPLSELHAAGALQRRLARLHAQGVVTTPAPLRGAGREVKRVALQCDASRMRALAAAGEAVAAELATGEGYWHLAPASGPVAGHEGSLEVHRNPDRDASRAAGSGAGREAGPDPGREAGHDEEGNTGRDATLGADRNQGAEANIRRACAR